MSLFCELDHYMISLYLSYCFCHLSLHLKYLFMMSVCSDSAESSCDSVHKLTYYTKQLSCHLKPGAVIISPAGIEESWPSGLRKCPDIPKAR